MKKARNIIQASNCYTPERTLKNYLEQRLQIERTEDNNDDAASANLTKKIKEMNRMKVYVLNKIIFPSMANVVYFLETVSENPELQKVFDDDLKELFGIRYPAQLKNKSYSPIIRRLTEAMINWREDTDETPYERRKHRNNNFRLALIAVMQHVIFQRIVLLSMDEVGGDMANFVVKNDVGRAWNWAQLLARSVEWDAGQPHRPTNF
jgi:hypothetical protein